LAQINEVSLSCIRYRVIAKSARRIAMIIQILMRGIRQSTSLRLHMWLARLRDGEWCVYNGIPRWHRLAGPLASYGGALDWILSNETKDAVRRNYIRRRAPS
jgi:hypothetical protein